MDTRLQNENQNNEVNFNKLEIIEPDLILKQTKKIDELDAGIPKQTLFKKMEILIGYFYQLIIETNLYDFIFSLTFNILGSANGYSIWYYVSKSTSMIILSMIVFFYLDSLQEALENPKNISPIKKDIITEGLNLEAINKFKTVRIMNLALKMKDISIIVIIVIG